MAPYIFAVVLDYAIRRATDEREENLGFKIDRKRSRRHHSLEITDTDFADDIAITTEEIHQPQEMLASLFISTSLMGTPLVIYNINL